MKKTLYIVLCLFPILFCSCRKTTSGIPAGAVQMWSHGSRSIYVADGGKSVWLANVDTCRCLLDSTVIDWIPVEGLEVLAEEPLCLLLEGKPDLRNVYSRIWHEGRDSLILLPSNAGLIGISDEEELLIMQSYEYYHQGGRYTRIEAYDREGKLVNSMKVMLHPEWNAFASAPVMPRVLSLH